MVALRPLLETAGLTRVFDGVTAVDDVDFSVPEGTIRGIIGPNGAGKTTLVSLICGRLRVSSGRIRFNGVDVTAHASHRRARDGIVYTFQVTSTFKHQTVYENVALAAQSRYMCRIGAFFRLDERRIRETVLEALHSVNLEDKQKEIVSNLPYGHQRLVEVAMSFALSPTLLILDEPTQGLSHAEIDRLSGVLKSLTNDMTVLVIEHNMPFVLAIAEAITVMDNGRILFQGSPDEVSNSELVQQTYLGE